MKKLLTKTNQKGITLVALVLTIIILLILAGISIQALTNQGIFGRANEAKRESEIASIKEQIALDIYEKQLVPPLGSITEEQLEEILGKYGTVNKGEDETIIGITTEKGYEILLKDIYVDETVAESVPDGAIVTPVNDITTWLKTAGISKQYSYTTIEQVIADTTCTQSLMNNENAMKYLARSTEFADAICTSETTMTYLGDSAYVDDTVLNSNIWVSKIPMSPYWNKVSNIAVTLHGGALEQITITGLYNSPKVTTNSDGNASYYLPIGTFTFAGALSGQSFTRTIDKNTVEIFVMPEGALYWYGNFTDTYQLKNVYQLGGSITENTNNFKFVSNSGQYRMIFDTLIDMTNYTIAKAKFDVTFNNSGSDIGELCFGIYSQECYDYNVTDGSHNRPDIKLTYTRSNGSSSIFEVDISEIDSSYRVGLISLSNWTNATSYFHAIWLE